MSTCQMGYPILTEEDDDGFLFMQDIVTLDEHSFMLISMYINSKTQESTLPEMYEINENGDVFNMKDFETKSFIKVI